MEKMQSGEFYDIRLPKVLDLSEVANEEYFPSLIGAQVKSEGAQ